MRDALLGDRYRYRHSRSCVEACLLTSLPPLCVFHRFLRCVLPWLVPWDLVCWHVLGLRIAEGSISLMLPSRRPLLGGVLGLQFVEGNISSMLPVRCVFLLIKCIGEQVVGLATTTFSKGPSYAAAAAATPRVDVEKDPQAAAALDCVDQSSQVPSRCLFQKHPVFFYDKIDEERRERKVREDGGDTVLLVRGLQGNTMVVQCGSGWTARDLAASLWCRTSVPVRLFYLVVEERVIDDDGLVRSLGRDCVVSMRGRVLGGSRNVSPNLGEWTCPGCICSGCWPTKNTCFRCGTVRPIFPLPPGPVLDNSRPVGRHVNNGIQGEFTELAQLEVELEEARRLIMQPAPPPTPPPSQDPRGHSSPRVSDVASSGMAVDAELLLPSKGQEKGPKRFRVGTTGEEAPSLQQVLAAQETFSMQELYSIMESFRQRHSLLEQEMIANEQRELEDALGWSG